MITWVQELTMMHRAIHLRQWHTVLMEQGPYMKFLLHCSDFCYHMMMSLKLLSMIYGLLIGCSHVGQIKKENHS